MPNREPLLVSEEWRRLRLGLRRWVKVSGLLFFALTIVVFLTQSGAWADISVRRTRHLIDLFWQLSGTIFAITGGILLWGWLVNRHGDRPDSQKSRRD
jgi:hypothetical protein